MLYKFVPVPFRDDKWVNVYTGSELHSPKTVTYGGLWRSRQRAKQYAKYELHPHKHGKLVYRLRVYPKHIQRG